MTLADARVLAARRLGIPLANGTPAEFAQLSQADQVRLTDETAVVILDNPQGFTPAQLDLARQRVASPSFRKPLADTSFSANLGEFATDFAGRVETRFFAALAIAIAVAVAANVISARLVKK